jgi:hypothetical protein
MRIRHKWLGSVLAVTILLAIVVLGQLWLDSSAEAEANSKFQAIKIGMSQKDVQKVTMDGSYMWSTLQSSDIYNSRDGQFMFLVLYEPPPGKPRIANWADERADPDWVVREKRLGDLRRWPIGLEGPMSILGRRNRLDGREVKRPAITTGTP